jgi:hypothetical protein
MLTAVVSVFTLCVTEERDSCFCPPKCKMALYEAYCTLPHLLKLETLVEFLEIWYEGHIIRN